MELIEELRRAAANYVVPGKSKRTLCAEAVAEIERLKVHAVVLANTEREVERERCAAACDAAAREYDVSAKHSLATEHGREWHRRAAEWARNMAAAIRAG